MGEGREDLGDAFCVPILRFKLTISWLRRFREDGREEGNVCKEPRRWK